MLNEGRKSMGVYFISYVALTGKNHFGVILLGSGTGSMVCLILYILIAYLEYREKEGKVNFSSPCWTLVFTDFND